MIIPILYEYYFDATAVSDYVIIDKLAYQMYNNQVLRLRFIKNPKIDHIDRFERTEK